VIANPVPQVTAVLLTVCSEHLHRLMGKKMFKWLKRLFVIARTRPTTQLDSITRADIGFEPGALTWLDCPRRL
jgi:hypothetical protein